MPAQEGQGGLFRKYGHKLNDAVQKGVEKPTEYGPIQIPAGIKDGRAQVVKCYFGIYQTGDNQGEYFFRAEAVCVEPYSVMDPATKKEQVCQGLRTSIQIPCCATTNSKQQTTSQEDNMIKVVNEMKKIAGDEYMAGATIDQLESLAKGIQEANPPIFIKFRTSAGKPTKEYPDPKIWENWDGSKGLEDYAPPDGTEGMIQEAQEPTEETPPPPPAARPKQAATSAPTPPKVAPTLTSKPATAPAAPKAAPTSTKKAAKTPEPPAPAFDEFQDLESLRAAAENGDLAAIDSLTEQAIAAGATREQVDEATNWSEVVALIEGGVTEEGEEDTATNDFNPQEGEVYAYKTPKMKEPVDCQVVSVDSDNRKFTLKNLTNPKLKYTDVSFDDPGLQG